MKRILIFLFLSLLPAVSHGAERPKSLFYLTSDPTSIHSFLAHADKVDLLVPTWYGTNSEGLVSGAPNPLVLEAAK